MMLILKPEASRPFALNKNNFKRCIRTTVSKWMRLIISIFIVQLSFILPKYQIYENMTLNQDHSNPRAHISSGFLVNCLLTIFLFQCSLHFQGSSKAPSFSSLLLGVCEEERGQRVGRLVLRGFVSLGKQPLVNVLDEHFFGSKPSPRWQPNQLLVH